MAQSPNTLIFCANDASPVAVSAADPLPVGSGSGSYAPTEPQSPDALIFDGPDNSPVAVSAANPLPVVFV